MSRIEDLLGAFKEATQLYHDAIRIVACSILDVNLPPCAGGCGRILFPRTQWRELPSQYRSELGKWMQETFALERCTPCYRRDVRSGKIEPIPRYDKIIPEEELEYLRRKVGMIK